MVVRTERWPRPSWVVIVVLCGLSAPGRVEGQEPTVPLQFSFSDPGARSLGFGGAFVALADDATAAFSNPAGLVQLAKPEVSIEGRRWSYSTPYIERGRVEGLPSGIGADTVAGLRTATSDDVTSALAFLSFAYPKGPWSFALFRHQLASLEFSSETHGLFGGGTDRLQERFFDQRVTTDLEATSYGLAAACRLGESFDIGLGVIYHDAFLNSLATVFLPDEDPVAGVLAPTSYLPERSFKSQSLLGEDSDWSLSGGFLWRLPGGWRIGGVYRQGPEVGIVSETRAGAANNLGVPPGEVLERGTVPVELPSVLGLGFAHRAADGGLTVSFQWDRIEYSTILKSLEAATENLRLDDADELHLGGEYVFLRSTPVIAVRFGAWLDPEHRLREMSDDPFLRAVLPPGEDQTHYALGLGVAFESFQVDVGVDLADEVDTLSVSAVYSF